MAQDKFDVGGMTCAACQAHVDRAVSKLDGVESVAVNLLAGSMLVDYDPAQVSPTISAPPSTALATRPHPSARAPTPPKAAVRKPGPAPPIWSRRP